MQLYIDTPNTAITVRNNSFNISNKKLNKIISPKRIESIGVTSNATFNASAIKLAAINEIPIYYYNYTGGLIAILQGPTYLKHSELRIKQIQFMTSIEGRTWAKDQLLLKTNLQLQTLNRLIIEFPKFKTELQHIVASITIHKISIDIVDLNTNGFSNSLMGIEGVIARYYFKGINIVIPDLYKFNKRTRQP